jgi:CRISPR/Cas system type I-B associated protein Csh2 (Cas7 group RAMP superfamily)
MRGIDADGIAQTEADHFMKCPGCREWFDMRDLGQVLAHVHDAEIEISEGPEPRRQGPLH